MMVWLVGAAAVACVGLASLAAALVVSRREYRLVVAELRLTRDQLGLLGVRVTALEAAVSERLPRRPERRVGLRPRVVVRRVVGGWRPFPQRAVASPPVGGAEYLGGDSVGAVPPATGVHPRATRMAPGARLGGSELAAQQRFSEETIARGVASLRDAYRASGVDAAEEDLRREVMDALNQVG